MTFVPERRRLHHLVRSNLYLSIRPASAGRPGGMRGPNGQPEPWLAVIEKFPDRFVLGSNNFIVQSTRNGAAEQFASRLGNQT